mmetsp:Transcript_25581/g.73888  ORF Transcript_25581/g.73888 Transcript_25581/m.73888 type:complete len:346 (+) Transcript_25581:1372-2409(+)
MRPRLLSKTLMMYLPGCRSRMQKFRPLWAPSSLSTVIAAGTDVLSPHRSNICAALLAGNIRQLQSLRALMSWKSRLPAGRYTVRWCSTWRSSSPSSSLCAGASALHSTSPCHLKPAMLVPRPLSNWSRMEPSSIPATLIGPSIHLPRTCSGPAASWPGASGTAARSSPRSVLLIWKVLSPSWHQVPSKSVSLCSRTTSKACLLRASSGLQRFAPPTRSSGSRRSTFGLAFLSSIFASSARRVSGATVESSSFRSSVRSLKCVLEATASACHFCSASSLGRKSRAGRLYIRIFDTNLSRSWRKSGSSGWYAARPSSRIALQYISSPASRCGSVASSKVRAPRRVTM